MISDEINYFKETKIVNRFQNMCYVIWKTRSAQVNTGFSFRKHPIHSL